MARAGRALAFLVSLPLLAGCVDPGGGPTAQAPPTEPEAQAGLAVPPSHLEAGTFYAFRHAGGTLSLGVLPGGRAQVELFDGSDQRLGQLSLSDALAGSSLDLRGMPAGDYVIRTLVVNGTLRIESGGGAPALRPLAGHVERHLLLQAPRSSLPTLPSLPDPSAAPPEGRDLALRLLRAPTSIRVLVDGDYSSLSLELHSALGPVVAAESSGFFTGGLASGGLAEVGSEFHGENVRDGRLAGRVEAQGLHGAVVLEASSYSRAEPLAAPAAPATGPPRFLYGSLPDAPVRFQTGPRATQLLLRGGPAGEEDNRSWVALFSERGQRIGTWAVASGATLAVAAAPSTPYIAVRLRGNVTLGADAAPADFELHPLEVRERTLPAEGAGSGGDYGQGEVEVDGAGVFAIEPALASGEGQVPVFGPRFTPQPCGGGAQVRVAQGNETLGHWEDDRFPLPASDAGLRLRDGPLRVLDDGFGTAGCPHLAARIKSFQA